MFYDIFSKIIKKQKKSEQKMPWIVADVHEKNSLVLSEIQASKQARLDIKNLKIGDYLVGKTIIERKTVSDFISSMLNKRLIQQLIQMQRYKKQILIIEGIKEQELYKKETGLNPNAVRGFILSILTKYQIPIIFTQNYKDTSQYLIILAKQQSKPETEMTLHQRIPRKLEEQKKYILEAFPAIGPITAKKLLKKFKTISNAINANEEELREILKSKTKSFKEILEN